MYPKDVMEAASKAWSAAYSEISANNKVGSHLPIAAAIMAERERCAKIAFDHEVAGLTEIAAAIRKGEA